MLNRTIYFLSRYPNIKPEGLLLLLGLPDTQGSRNLVHKNLRKAKSTLRQTPAQRFADASSVAHAQVKIPRVLIALPPDSDPASPNRANPSVEGLIRMTESTFSSPSVSVGTPGPTHQHHEDRLSRIRAFHPEGYLRDIYLEAASTGQLVTDYSRRISTPKSPF